MAMDYYSDAEVVAIELMNQGLALECAAVLDVIRAASTGSEALMGLRWHLQEIKQMGRVADAGTQRRIDALLINLDAVLSQ